MLELLRREREYMQLHRDVTVSSLTQTPTLVNGQLVWEDSPLVDMFTERPHIIEVDVAPDNRGQPSDLPIAPWC